MKTPSFWLLVIAALAIFALARASVAQQHPTPAPAPAPATATAPPTQAPAPSPAKHTITVHFDYNFSATPPCSQQPANERCVQQFIIYDISGGVLPGRRFQLFTVPVPPGAKGAMRQITGTSPPLAFQSGRHLLAITAQMPDKKESNPTVSQFWIKIP